MTDDIERLRLDTVHEDHPLRLLCAETRRLEAELEQMRDLAKQNGGSATTRCAGCGCRTRSASTCGGSGMRCARSAIACRCSATRC